MKLIMSRGLMIRVFGLVSNSHVTVRIAPKVIRPCARTNGDRPPFIKYLETTPLDAHNTAAPRQAMAPLVVGEREMIATVKI